MAPRSWDVPKMKGFRSEQASSILPPGSRSSLSSPPPTAREIPPPETPKGRVPDYPSDRIMKRLGALLHTPGFEDHTEKLAIFSKANELRRSTVRSSLAKTCLQTDLTEAEWDQLESALNSTPRVLSILKCTRVKERPILRDTVRFQRTLQTAHQLVDGIDDNSTKKALQSVLKNLMTMQKVKSPGRFLGYAYDYDFGVDDDEEEEEE